MEVILTQDVEHLGKSGKVAKVKDGFARNYLFPRKLAFPATKENLRKIENLEKRRKAEYEQEKQKAQALADKLNKVSCTISVEVNDLEKLYGHVNDSDIQKALEVEGYPLDRKTFIIEKPIDELGIFEVGIKLHPEVIAKVRVWVTKK